MRKIQSLVLLLAVVLSTCGGSTFRGSPLDEPMSIPDVTLIDEHEQPFRLSDLQGSIVLLFFGYTSCPDVCPTTLATWRKVHQSLGSDAERVRFVFVTVDQERDTPARLQLHVDAFNPEFVGATGPPAELDSLYQAFSVQFEKNTSSGSALGYLISHTATTFVLDTKGKWRLRETYGTAVEDLVYDIRLLLE